MVSRLVRIIHMMLSPHSNFFSSDTLFFRFWIIDSLLLLLFLLAMPSLCVEQITPLISADFWHTDAFEYEYEYFGKNLCWRCDAMRRNAARSKSFELIKIDERTQANLFTRGERVNEQIQNTNTNTNAKQKSLQAVERMNEWTTTTSSLWSFVWRVTSSAELTASSTIFITRPLSIALSLSHSFDLDTYLCALYMHPYVDQMWIRDWPLGCRPKRLKTIAYSVGGNLACNSATLIRFWVSDSLPHSPRMCVNHIWLASNRERSRGKTHSHGKRKMAEGRTKESQKDVAKSRREKLKKAFAKWKRIKLP